MRKILVPIHREGWRFIAIFAVVTLVLFQFSDFLGWVGVILTLWCVYFFRDPPRIVPTRPGLIVSPGDGVVQMIERAVPPPELEMGTDPRPRISIFLNVFNVHVNRVPADGKVVKAAYRPGKFFNAALDKASEMNERQSVRLALDDGREIAFVQIAGLVARRIVCDLVEGQRTRAGERFGLIRFGSRCDVYLDEGMAPLVAVGQSVLGGETVIADALSNEPPRQGEER
ncbi:MAG: phosphatidylserine decarboxylase [Alphaproteobacteria bacterium]|nr:phosphatidylserine decarboxylase [Alphaproteobacteria bacterium]